MALYLHCALCGRKQADGLLSSSSWGRVPLPSGMSSDHPAVSGSAVRTCPSCRAANDDWESQALAAVGVNGATPA